MQHSSATPPTKMHKKKSRMLHPTSSRSSRHPQNSDQSNCALVVTLAVSVPFFSTFTTCWRKCRRVIFRHEMKKYLPRPNYLQSKPNHSLCIGLVFSRTNTYMGPSCPRRPSERPCTPQGALSIPYLASKLPTRRTAHGTT